ncbi:MAG: hypothetical protein QM784_30650 [Polyangiaceae bacterium]
MTKMERRSLESESRSANKPPTKSERRSYNPEVLQRELYDRSQALTRAAHALVVAADQLRQAHSRDYGKSETEVRAAALVAMHAALSAYELIGRYELAAWLASASEAESGHGR